MKDILARYSGRRIAVLLLCAFVAVMFSVAIWEDSQPRNGFISFQGKSEFIVVSLSPIEPQYQWSLAGAYICYEPDAPPPEGLTPASGVNGDDALCGGPYGDSGKKHFALSGDESLTVLANTTIAVAVVDPSSRVDAKAFPRGKAPEHLLIITKTAPLESKDCQREAIGSPTISSETTKFDLWEQAEIQIPVDEKTLMPFAGRLSLGQPNSAETSTQLRSGVLAVYRHIYPWLGGLIGGAKGPHLVRETNLFPGDVVKFTKGKCLVNTAGFLKAGQDDQGGFIEVVASMQSADGAAVVERSAPGSDKSTSGIVVDLQLADAIFSHPYTVYLGLMLTLFVLVKEALEFCRRETGDDQAGPEPDVQRGFQQTSEVVGEAEHVPMNYTLTFSKKPSDAAPRD